MTLPAGATYFDGLATAGDRLAVLFNEPQTPEDPGGSVVTVATTTDLVNWTTQEVVPPALPVELPAGIQRRVNGQGLVANDSGWAITVFDSVDVDVLQLVPDDVRAKLESSDGGFGVERRRRRDQDRLRGRRHVELHRDADVHLGGTRCPGRRRPLRHRQRVPAADLGGDVGRRADAIRSHRRLGSDARHAGRVPAVDRRDAVLARRSDLDGEPAAESERVRLGCASPSTAA